MPYSNYVPGVKADFDRLYSDSYPKIFATTLVLLRDPVAAEDCTQETFVKAFKAWRHWRADAPAEAWLHSIAVNVVISWKRKEKVRNLVSGSFGHEPPEVAAAPTQQDTNLALVEALRQLPPPQAMIIVMRHLHGYSNREIAQALKISESTVASRLAMAKTKLQKLVDTSAD